MKIRTNSGTRRPGQRGQGAVTAVEACETRTLLTATPVITGPLNLTAGAAVQKIEAERPALEWSPVADASQYEIYLSNLTAKTNTSYTVPAQVNASVISVNSSSAAATIQIALTTSTVTFQNSTLFVPTAVKGTYRIRLAQAGPPAAQADTVLISFNAGDSSVQNAIRALPGYEDVTVVATQGTTGTTYTVAFNRVYSAVTMSVTQNTTGVSPVSTVTQEFSSSDVRQVTGSLPLTATADEFQAAVRSLPGYSKTHVVITSQNGGNLSLQIEFREFSTAPNTNASSESQSVVSMIAEVEVTLPSSGGTAGVGVLNGGTVENTWFEFPIADVPAMNQFQVFMRAVDSGDVPGNWTPAFGAPQRSVSFETTPRVQSLSPAVTAGKLQLFPELDTTPLLSWKAVTNATHYQLEVRRQGVLIYRKTDLTTNSFLIPSELSAGNYTFRVMATRKITGRPADTVNGNWSPTAAFTVGKATVSPQTTTLTISGAPTQGTFQLSLRASINGGQTLYTSAVPYNTTAAKLQAAIRAVPGYSNVIVTSVTGIPGSVHTIQFRGINGPVSLNVVNDTTSATFTTKISQQTQLSVPGRTEVTGFAGQPVGESLTHKQFPIISWRAVDKALSYEVWINKTLPNTSYVRTTTTENYYRLETAIPNGVYVVWVRATGPSGMTSQWSLPFTFTAASVPTILTPAAGSTTAVSPLITWTPIQGAASYLVNLRRVAGGAYFEQETPVTPDGGGVLATSLQTVLPAGTYRAWVKAVLADGTELGWSSYVEFTLTATDAELQPRLEPTLLASILIADRPASSVSALPGRPAERTQPVNRITDHVDESSGQKSRAESRFVSRQTIGQQVSADSSNTPVYNANRDGNLSLESPLTSKAGIAAADPAELESLQNLAADCDNAEWWAS